MKVQSLVLLGLLVFAPYAALAQGDLGDNAVDDRVHASALAAESLQGPMDGGWTLVSAAGQAIFAFQLVDKPGGRDPLEGVWRDLRRPMTPGDIGMIDSLIRGPSSLVISFASARGPATVVTLKSGADGGWSGRLNEAGAVTQVTLRHS